MRRLSQNKETGNYVCEWEKYLILTICSRLSAPILQAAVSFQSRDMKSVLEGGWGGQWRGVKIGEDKMECQTWLHYYRLFMDQTLLLWPSGIDCLLTGQQANGKIIQKNKEKTEGEYKDGWSLIWTHSRSGWSCVCFLSVALYGGVLFFLGLPSRFIFVPICLSVR